MPSGLSLDAKTGRITGTLSTEGDYTVTLTATNSAGKDSKPLLIKIGDAVVPGTPPMGWNSWNCFGGGAVDQEKSSRPRLKPWPRKVRSSMVGPTSTSTTLGSKSGLPPINALQPK